MLKIFIIALLLIGLFLYAIVHVSARSVDDEMQKRMDEEQAEILSEMEKKDN